MYKLEINTEGFATSSHELVAKNIEDAIKESSRILDEKSFPGLQADLLFEGLLIFRLEVNENFLIDIKEGNLS
jgi:hypothetical protein